MSIGSFPQGESSVRSNLPEKREYSSLKLCQPSLSPFTMIFVFTVSVAAIAFSASSATSPSAVQRIADIPAALKRYSKS